MSEFTTGDKIYYPDEEHKQVSWGLKETMGLCTSDLSTKIFNSICPLH